MYKEMKNSLLFLGTGASSGVPVIGCSCSVCRSKDSHNKRLRPSVLLTLNGKKIIIDVGPDFREQALMYQVKHLDGVIITHAHYDHVAGLDELRAYYIFHRTSIPVLCSIETLEELKKKFDYLFRKKKEGASLAAQLHFQVLENGNGETFFLDQNIRYITYQQGEMSVNGYVFGPVAYFTDVKEFDETLMHSLEGVEVLVISALREEPSRMHLTFDQAAEIASKSGVKKCFFTHISHESDYKKINRKLPKECALAYDGLLLNW